MVELYPVGYPLQTGTREFFRSITSTRGRVADSSGTRPRELRIPGHPDSNTELFAGTKAG